MQKRHLLPPCPPARTWTPDCTAAGLIAVYPEGSLLSFPVRPAGAPEGSANHAPLLHGCLGRPCILLLSLAAPTIPSSEAKGALLDDLHAQDEALLDCEAGWLCEVHVERLELLLLLWRCGVHDHDDAINVL
jgi:hypothetical protein